MDDWLESQTTEVEVEETNELLLDSPPDPVVRNLVQSEYAIRILCGLGFTDGQINTMKAETAAKIISAGYLASCTEILDDGDFQVIEASNLVALPKATQFS